MRCNERREGRAALSTTLFKNDLIVNLQVIDKRLLTQDFFEMSRSLVSFNISKQLDRSLFYKTI